jgi:signal transduction histidine kinase
MKTATSCCLALLLAAPPIRAETRQPLVSIPEITRLEPEIAVTEIPVELRATVTFCKPEISTLLVHDGNQGVYVWRDILPADAGPRTGDLVLVRGVTKPGDFSPSIGGPGTAAAEVKVLSSGDLPVPETIEGPDLGIPEKDCDWVSLEAEVLEVIIRYGDLVLECRAGGFDFFILLKGPLPADAVPWGLAECRIRVRGVVCSSFNSMRQMTRRFLRVSSLSDIESLGYLFDRQPPANTTPIDQLFRIGGPGPSDLVRIRGVTTLAIPGRGYYLGGESGGIWVQTAQPIATRPGIVIEAEGRPRSGQAKPYLHARHSRSLGTTTIPEPLRLDAADAIEPRFDSQLISTQGDLLGTQPSEDGRILELRSRDKIFRGILPGQATGSDSSVGLLPGSRVALTGIAEISASGTNDPMQEIHSLTIRMRSPADLQILSRPPFWTAPKVAAGSGAVILALVGTSAVARGRRKAEQAVQRREFEAVLAERGRFAREIHDSLAQGLTSISLQLECVPEQIESDPSAARRHVARARSLVSDSLVEARRTIWNLRPLALGEADLATVLSRFTKDLSHAGDVVFSQEIEGTLRAIPTELEDALLRIAQEAITNAIRHGSPTRVNTRLRFGPDWVTLVVRDDGGGFDVASRAVSGFGLTSMRERADALDGSLTIESQPGRGTVISVTLPL